jgi:hypothetical protein
MRIDTFMVAEAARASEGRLYIHGGGISRIAAPILPWTHPQLALAVRLEATAEEPAGEVAFTIIDPSEVVVLPRTVMPLNAMFVPPTDEPQYANLALTVSPITFHREGPHSITCEVRDDARTLQVFLEHAPHLGGELLELGDSERPE